MYHKITVIHKLCFDEHVVNTIFLLWYTNLLENNEKERIDLLKYCGMPSPRIIHPQISSKSGGRYIMGGVHYWGPIIGSAAFVGRGPGEVHYGGVHDFRLFFFDQPWTDQGQGEGQGQG